MDQEQTYIDYMNYDWDSFDEFKEGLKEILDGFLENMKEQDPSVTAIPPLDKQQLIDQAKSFFYCSHTGNILNLDDYNQWKRSNGDKHIKNNKISELTETDEPQLESKAIDTTDTKDAKDSKQEPKETTDGEAPPYSSNYQELVQLIMSGKPVPGIKEIPDTVLPEQSSKSTAKQRTKPWET